ncbi:hypothetical protein [Streptosporangium sp. 'caverna']|uniref:hypothetical protein n=1 Tax=Streptosporangium sp. 'caverna' TaxID=2202249 RepID=UPI000D7D463A|nr:hypothetical protein [Streptosporangium sp. 'caverna']AWS46907.1 hypothetical protein DKM19_42040 [Streptosporangium sp. 'caverna']
MQEVLTYQDHLFVNFSDFHFEGHGYRWVDIKRFGLPRPDTDDAHLLAELIGHEQYRDDYAGGGVDIDGVRHGPYWLRNLSPTAYAHVDEVDAKAIFRRWAEQYGELPTVLSARLEREVHPLISGATGRHQLKNIGREAFHDWGGIHDEFHELILIDRVAETLSLLVAADD